MVVEELVACDSQVQEALADPLEVVQDIAQARPYAFHRVTVHTRIVGVTTRILARTMVDRPMVVVGLSEAVNALLPMSVPLNRPCRQGLHPPRMKTGCNGISVGIRWNVAFSSCIAMDNPPPCGYYARMMASEGMLRRRD